jgi:hypothetical protein
VFFSILFGDKINCSGETFKLSIDIIFQTLFSLLLLKMAVWLFEAKLCSFYAKKFSD